MANPTYDKLLQLAHASLLEKAQVAVGETDLNVFWFIAEVGGINAEVAVAQQILNALWPEIQDLLVAAWHSDSLHEALGMTEEEYTKWVENRG